MISKSGGGKILNFVVDRNTGQPLANIRVVALARNQTLEEVQTNGEGIAELHPTCSWADDVRVIARNGRDVAAAVLFGGLGDAERWTGYIYSDRPIYRPGQTVHFKGILRVHAETGYDVPAGKTVKVEIQDPDAKPVYQRSVTISTNGTFRDELKLAPVLPSGIIFYR